MRNSDARSSNSRSKRSIAGDLADQAVKPVILFDLPGRIIQIGGLVKNIDLSP